MLIRPATAADATAASQVMRRSIIELCVTDHQGDAATLALWLANKTPDMFQQWLANPNNFCVVADDNHHLQGVGLIRRNGYVALLYLAPGTQRRGIGKAIYLALEAQAKNWGLTELTTESTTDSRAFYEAMGFQSTGDAVLGFGVTRGWPYGKLL